MRKAKEKTIKKPRSRTKVAAVEKAISYSSLFAHGLPMELFFKQVTRPYENISTVYKSIKALCDNVPQAKLKIYNKSTEEEVDDERVLMLLRNPNKRQSQADFIQEWVGFYALYGEGFIKKITGVAQMAGIANLPANLVCLDPSRIKEMIDYQTNELTGWKIGTLALSLDEVVHTKDFNPYNPYRGMSPLKPIDDEIEIDQSSLTFNNAFFKNNATAGMILSTDGNLTEEQRERIRKVLDTKYAGSGGANAFKTLVLEKGLKPQDAGQHSHKDMEFIEQKRLMREEIMGIWRTPKALFNITEDLNYSTFMGQMRVFWIYALMPIMRKLEDSLNKHIIEPYRSDIYLAFDYSDTPAFQEDYKERVSTAEILNRVGFTGNEINDKLRLGFDKKDWRDIWWIPFSQVPAETNVNGQTNNNQPDGQLPEEEEPKSITERKSQFLKMFGIKQTDLENRMTRKMSRYLMELRADVLKLSEDNLGNGFMDIDWNGQNEKIKKMFSPLIKEGIERGIALGESVLGRKKSPKDDAFSAEVSSFLQVRADKITGINSRIRSRLQDVVSTVLEQTIQQGGSLTDKVNNVRDGVRDFFNLTADRARLIARTESVGAVNGGSMLYYASEGVEKKEWVTAHDENVRPSHRACEREGAIGMDRSFNNGLMYPGDQANGDAAEVVNCRCSILPIVE